MTHDPNDPEVLVSLATAAEAASMVTALAERDIEASTSDSSAFPGALGLEGGVQVMVKRSDFDRAKEALEEIRKEFNEVDWSKIDVGEADESTSDPPR